MDLFICGSNPLLEHRQPLACQRWHRDFSNDCTHVPPGRVEVGTKYQICPLSVLVPIHVLSSQRSIKFVKTEAQNLVVIDDEKILWSSDGIHDIRRDFGKYMTHSQSHNIQDMWPEPDALIPMERMFDCYYGPVFTSLGLLTRDGAIYAIDQAVEPGMLIERTSSRRPFRHALIRREINNMKGDTWPCVVFEEQPRVIYRLRTVPDLLRWLDGSIVQFSIFTFPSGITHLLTSGGVRGKDCMALTEEGKVYYWARDAPVASQTGILSEQLQVSPISEKSPSINVDMMGNERSQALRTMPIPAITHLVAGGTYGAAIATTGQLYIFLTRPPRCNSENECTDPTLAEFYVDKFTVCDPYTPCLAKIPGQDAQPAKMVDVAVGFDHLVALSSEGDVFTAGGGMYGQLGVGGRQFDLHAQKHQDNDDEESWEFAEHWQKIEISDEEMSARGDPNGQSGRKRVLAVQAGSQSTLLIVGDGR